MGKQLCKKLCKERTWNNLESFQSFSNGLPKNSDGRGFFNHPLGQDIGSHLSSFNLPRGWNKTFLSHLRRMPTFPGTHFPVTFAAAVTPGQQEDQLIYSKLGRLGRFGWAEAILLENFREKKPQHKMKVGWFKGSSSRFQNSKITVISAEDWPYLLPLPFRMVGSQWGSIHPTTQWLFCGNRSTVTPGICLIPQTWGNFMPPALGGNYMPLNHLWLVQRYAVLYKMGPVKPTLQMGWNGPTNWSYKWVTGVK